MKINKTIPYLSLVVSVLLLISCGTVLESGGVPPMPEHWPENFKVEYYEGGGMNPEYSNIFISRDSSWVEYNYMSNANRHYFHTENIELDKLWITLKTNFLTQIKTREEKEVYDRGGTHITVSWDKETFKLSDAGLTFVEPEWQEHYYSIVKAIENLPAMNLAKSFLNFPVNVTDQTGGDSLSVFQCQFDMTSSAYWTGKPNEHFVTLHDSIRLLPGKYNLMAYAKVGAQQPSINENISLNDSVEAFNISVFKDHIQLSISKK